MNAGSTPRPGAQSQIIEQNSNIFWCSFCIVVAASVGCDRINNTQDKNKLELEHHAAQSSIISDSAVEVQVEETKANRKINLEVDISGFGNSKGTCGIAIYIGQSHFNDPEFAIAKEWIHIVDLKAIWQVQIAIPNEGNGAVESRSGIAVSAYHDENENSRLDKNAFGIPTEPYGFSKNPKRGYGPPTFSETAIDVLSAKQLSDSNVTLKVPIQIK
ncbi:MAG TPA: DUF2141 domain-containing protein [Pirellula sp.]|nr:DUF2141 domain-containing protein [Pirellula sp.]